MPNDTDLTKRSYTRGVTLAYRLRPEGQFQNRTAGDTLSRTVGFEPTKKRAFKARHAKHSSGIHYGSSSRTAVKEWLKHLLEVCLQAYFTIIDRPYHGKKAAKWDKI